MKLRRCAQHPLDAEFSLCGDAFDGFASGDLEEDYGIASEKEYITCDRCCRMIKEIKQIKNRLSPRGIE